MRPWIPWQLLLFRLIIGSIVVVFSPYSIIVSRGAFGAPHVGVAMFVGIVLIALGLFAYFKSIWDFVDFAPTTVIATGTYRFVRNPMYAGMILILAGESVLARLPVLVGYTATTWLLIHLLVVLYEEPAMARRFGPAYDAYRGDVPRWLPRVRSVRPTGRKNKTPANA
jgi:protein-S-isoprenylcysteine O-methyltransferase Ste14